MNRSAKPRRFLSVSLFLAAALLLAVSLLYLFFMHFRIEPEEVVIYSEREVLDARAQKKHIRLRMDVYPGGNPGDRRIPVLLIGGGGWSMGVPQRNALNHWIDLQRDSRFRIFSMEYRSVDCGPFAALTSTTPENACHVHPAQVEDVDAAAAFLAKNEKKFGIDSSKLILLGDSSGGHTAALYALRATRAGCQGLETCGQKIAGVVAFASPLGLRAALVRNPAFRILAARLLNMTSDRLARAIEGMDADANALNDADPVRHLHKDMPSVLMVHSREDFFVPHEVTVAFETESRKVVHVPPFQCNGVTHEHVHEQQLPESVQPASHALFFSMLAVSKHTYLEEWMPSYAVDALFRVQSALGATETPDMSALSPAIRTAEMRRDLSSLSHNVRDWMACRADK